MELTGLGLGQVLGVLGGFGAAVVILYLLKLRRRQVQVPFVKLWEQVLAEKQTTRLFSQLKRLLSLLIALAVVAMLAFALGDPRWAGASSAGRTLVVLVDASASMQATDTEEGDRLATARERVRGMIDELGPNDRMLVAQMAATTTPVSPLSGEPRVLRDSLAGLEHTDVAADLGAGLRLAADVLRAEPEAEVVVVSDGRLEPAGDVVSRLSAAGVRTSYVKVGSGSRNLAITAFSVRRYPLDKSQSEVLVEVWNPTGRAETVELSLLGDGQPIDVQRLSVEPGERLRRFFRNVSGADRTLEAHLSLAEGGRDQLPADDRAFARLPERRRARILAVTDGNLYLSAALLLDEYLDVTEVKPAEYPVEGRFDVIIFDGVVPEVPPDAHAIYLGLSPAEGVQGPWVVGGRMERPFFDRVEERHPIVQFTALRDVNVAEAIVVEPAPGDRVIAADERGPLILAGTRDGRRIVGLTFDVRRSDLPLRVAWPLILLNSVDWFVQEDTGYVSSYRTGETWHVPAPAGVETATIVDPRGEERDVPVVEGRAVYAGTLAGFYTLRAGEQEDVFAANLGPSEEARIEPAETLALTEEDVATTPTRGKAGVRQELWIYLVLFAFLVLVAEWLTYHRRWTV